MELFDEEIDQDRNAGESSGRSETRQGRAKSTPARGRKMGKAKKKRATSRRLSGRRRASKRTRTPVVPSAALSAPRPRPEPPSIIPQPSLGAEDEEPTTDEGEQRQEPPAPSASAIIGDDDDLFEYVF